MPTAALSLPTDLDGAELLGVPLATWYQVLLRRAGLDLQPALPGGVCGDGPTVIVDGRYPAVRAEALAELARSLDEDGGLLVGPAGDVIAAALPEGATGRALAAALEGARGSTVIVVPPDEAQPASDRWALCEIEAQLRRRQHAELVRAGVRLVDPNRLIVGLQVRIAPGALIWPDVVLGGTTTIAAGAEIQAGAWLVDTEVAEGAIVKPHSVCEGASIGPRCSVGPLAHLRPGATLHGGSKVGNFVEVKNAVLHAGAKASHLTYLGDAEIGADANIGAGTITCNYDGFSKHHTSIGAGAFIGSNTALVAPVRVGAGAIVGAGSVITRDVPDNALAVERAPQRTLEGRAESLRARARARRRAEEG